MSWFPANLTSLQQLVLFMVAMVTGLFSIYASNIWVLTLLSIRGRDKLPDPPRLNSWPMISVHIALYNERSVTRRVLSSCVNLNYPREKLEILVLDDSDDGTTDIAREFEVGYPGLVRVIHRPEQVGFKAGALQEGLRNSHGEFIALFDADCVPPRNFLKRIVPYFYFDEKIALAQARRGYLDGEFSWLAKATSLATDVYAFVDQRARYVGNLLAHFSGSCGIFRRRALMDVGGWNSDTSAEDLDLSIRLHLAGWCYVYVPSVVCPGEIPASFDILKHQNFRWARGFSECLRKHGSSILRSKRLSLFQKLEALLHLCTYFIFPLTVIGIVTSLLYYSIFPPSFWLTGFWRYQVALLTFVLSLVIYSAPLISSGVALSELSHYGMSKVRRLLHLGYLGALIYGMLLSNTKAVIEGLFSRTIYFYRTPKQGSRPTSRER